jgi:hypothetical protein
MHNWNVVAADGKKELNFINWSEDDPNMGRNIVPYTVKSNGDIKQQLCRQQLHAN